MQFSPSRAALVLIAALLVGYAFLGRPFQYVGVPPVFVGDVVLVLGLLAAVLSGGVAMAMRSPLAWLLVAFMGWGALRTLPYIGTYGVDALRDAVLWGYALFALIVSGLLQRSGWLPRVTIVYSRFAFWLVIWAPVAVLFSIYFSDRLPVIPGSPNVPIFNLKAGEPMAHVAGAASFVLLGLGTPWRSKDLVTRRLNALIWWMLWLFAFVIGASLNRGSMLAVSISFGFVCLFIPAVRAARIASIGGCLLIVVLSTISLDLGNDRAVSSRRLMDNLTSIVVHSGADNTAEWRLEWWNDIVNYTIHGDYFWGGKGFGINLADDDGYQVWEDDSLRSPHNGHLTVLARMGVPGLALWVLLQCAFAGALLQAFWRARHCGQYAWARLNIWILAYWLAYLIHASFDVWLESPIGGIWFWSLFGFGLAAMEAQKRQFASGHTRHRILTVGPVEPVTATGHLNRSAP